MNLKKKFFFDFIIVLPAISLLVFMLVFLQHWQAIVLGMPSAGYYWLTPVSRLILVASGIVWLWMFIDCLKRKMTAKQKTIWLIVIILGSWIGAVMYYVFVKRKFDFQLS